MFPGGIADKTGNRYEAKWAVLKLLHVILGRADAIRLESLEKAAHGFEFELHCNGSVEWHQTKRRGPGNWTLQRLQREAVLTNFGTRLTYSVANRCVFVSSEPAKEMTSLVEKASVANGYDQFDHLLPEELRPPFLRLQAIWTLTPADTFSALRRCEFLTLPEVQIDGESALLADVIFVDPIETVFPILREHLERNLNRLLTTEAVRAEIGGSGLLRFRDAALDPTLRERVASATGRYLQSYIPFGFGGRTISRRESSRVVSLLCEPEGPVGVLLTGTAGSGKSGVVREVIEQLRERDVPVLAFRVDRVLDVATVADLGQRLIDHRGNPCTTLSRLFPSASPVLVVDQVDAISEASGRVASAREMVLELVDTGRRLGNVHLLLVCRSFDLDNDERLKMLAQSGRIERVDVPALHWKQDAQPVLAKAGVDVSRLTPKQQTLLTLPLNLSTFLEAANEGEDLRFASTADLFDRLIERKDRGLRQRGIQGFSLWPPLTAMARWMSGHQLLDAPESVLDGFPGALDLLASEHLITRQGGRIAFFHESFFDHAFSRDFVREGRRIGDFLTSDEQHLFRRTQVRQILTAFRHAGDQPRYLAELRDVLCGERIRYHLRDAVARWLGTVETPTDGELDVMLELDREGDRPPALVRLALYGNPAWFPLLRDRGLLDRWLALGGERKSGALFLLASAARDYPDEVVALLRNWWNGDSQRSEDLVNWFLFLGERRPSRALLGLYLAVIRSRPRGVFEGKGRLNQHELADWIKSDPDAAGEVLKTWFETWFVVHPNGHPFERDDSNHLDLYWMGQLAQVSPAAFLHGAVSGFVRTVERIAAAEAKGEHDWTWRIRHRARHLYGSDGFLELVCGAFRTLAGSDPERARLLLTEIDPRSHPAALYLHLEAVAGSKGTLSQFLIPLITLEGPFDAGPSGAPWLSLAQAARSALPHLSRPEQSAVENLILSHWPEIAYAGRCAHEAEASQPANGRSIVTEVVRVLNVAGFQQWAILKTIGAAALSPSARRRLEELERKFKGRQVPEPESFEMIRVESPVPKDRASYMTDGEWLEAIRTHNKEHPQWPRRGGPAELAQVLQGLAKEQPARFARLMARLPEDTPNDYPAAILRGLAEAEPEPDDLRSAVEAAHNARGRPFGREICRLIEKNPAVVMDEATFNAFQWYVDYDLARPPEARPATEVPQEKFDIEHLVYAGSELYIQGLNDIRGAAAEALGAVIWDCPERLEQAIGLLERRIDVEQSAGVRCCLIRPTYSVLHHDQRRAAELVRRLVMRDGEPDLTPLMTHIGLSALCYVLNGAPETGRELLDLLLASTDQCARLIGAYHLFREAFGDDSLAHRADALVEVDLFHRLLAAAVAAANLGHAATRSRAELQLRRFFDDPDKGVRREAAQCFRNLEHDDLDPYRGLMSSFIASRAFEEDNFAFFVLLKETGRNVHAEVIAAAERLMDIASRETERRHYHGEIAYLDDLIVREYAGLADKPDQRRRVLDIIDRMLELGLYGADKIVSAHERM